MDQRATPMPSAWRNSPESPSAAALVQQDDVGLEVPDEPDEPLEPVAEPPHVVDDDANAHS